jgi:hypothetical protein
MVQLEAKEKQEEQANQADLEEEVSKEDVVTLVAWEILENKEKKEDQDSQASKEEMVAEDWLVLQDVLVNLALKVNLVMREMQGSMD